MCRVCCLLTEEEEDSAPRNVEEQRKMSQDSTHHTTGNELQLPGKAYFGFVHFLTAPTLTPLPKAGSSGVGVLRLINCLAPFRMHENHLRRIYKVSQFIQGIPS